MSIEWEGKINSKMWWDFLESRKKTAKMKQNDVKGNNYSKTNYPKTYNTYFNNNVPVSVAATQIWVYV